MKVTLVEETPTPPPQKVVIELSEDEAMILRKILDRWSSMGMGASFSEVILLSDLHKSLHTVWGSKCQTKVT